MYHVLLSVVQAPGTITVLLNFTKSNLTTEINILVLDQNSSAEYGTTVLK